MSICAVPDRVRPIVDAYCLATLHQTCPKLPCVLVCRSNATNKRNIYLANGRIKNNVQIPQTNSSQVREIECITSPALELFAHRSPYPSLTTNGYARNGESIRYYPRFGTKSMLLFFDITLGYDHDLSDVVSDGYFPMEQRFLVPDGRVSLDSAILTKQQSSSYVTAPVFWMNSNCDTPSNRSKKAMIKHYTFTIAIENSLEHDYVTGKLWQPLAAGRIPLYYGAPNVDDWFPCQDCIIDLRKFSNPQAAAEFITSIANNITLYTQFHK